MTIKTVGIIGAGLMGNGIAQTCAAAGINTIMLDINETAVQKGLATISSSFERLIKKEKLTAEQKDAALSRIRTSSSMADMAAADIVIEAATENEGLRLKILKDVETVIRQDTIIASNTSSISITQMAAGTSRPDHFIGMHFFNPAPIMKFVEVISGAAIEAWVSDVTFALAKKMGKTPVHAQDEPGFIVNRVARHYYLESLKLLEENGTDHETIDRLMENVGFKMGPFKLMDLIGVETNHEVTKSLYEAFFHDEKFRPSRVQQKKVDAGHFGRKTGRGFYNY